MPDVDRHMAESPEGGGGWVCPSGIPSSCQSLNTPHLSHFRANVPHMRKQEKSSTCFGRHDNKTSEGSACR